MRPFARALLCALGALGASACREAVPQPALAPQPDDAFVEVPYPPPAARVEELPARPPGHPLWTDGQWSWDGTRWTWSPGGWVVPPPGGRFAPWAVRRLPDGQLQFAPASWRDAAGRELPPARVVAAALGEATNRTLPARCP